MSYFKRFPDIRYAGSTAVNILRAVLPSRVNVDQTYIYQDYRIQDGETAESIADKLYGDADKYWTILVVNSIIDPIGDWPSDDMRLRQMVDANMPGGAHAIHHYTDDNRDGKRFDDVDEAAYRLIPNSQLPNNVRVVTNYDEAKRINDARRLIVVINPRYVSSFVETYTKAVEGKL